MSVTYNAMEDGKLAVQSPYLPALPPQAKALGGRWNSAGRVWVYDIRDEDRVRAMYDSLYGAADEELVTLVVPASETTDSGSVIVAGRIIADRRGRDYAVRLGEGVTLIAGKLSRSGGSVKHPRVDADSDVIYQIRDVPRSLAEVWLSETGRVWEDGGWQEGSKLHPASRIL